MEVDPNALIERIYSRLDKISDDISDIKIDVAKNQKDLETHIRRTELNEQMIENLNTRLIPFESAKSSLSALGWTIAKFIGFATGLLGLIAAGIALFK